MVFKNFLSRTFFCISRISLQPHPQNKNKQFQKLYFDFSYIVNSQEWAGCFATILSYTWSSWMDYLNMHYRPDEISESLRKQKGWFWLHKKFYRWKQSLSNLTTWSISSKKNLTHNENLHKRLKVDLHSILFFRFSPFLCVFFFST